MVSARPARRVLLLKRSWHRGKSVIADLVRSKVQVSAGRARGWGSRQASSHVPRFSSRYPPLPSKNDRSVKPDSGGNDSSTSAGRSWGLRFRIEARTFSVVNGTLTVHVMARPSRTERRAVPIGASECPIPFGDLVVRSHEYKGRRSKPPRH